VRARNTDHWVPVQCRIRLRCPAALVQEPTAQTPAAVAALTPSSSLTAPGPGLPARAQLVPSQGRISSSPCALPARRGLALAGRQ